MSCGNVSCGLAGVDGDDDEYLAFCNEYGRHHADKSEYEMRRQTFSSHKSLIEETNAANRTYKLAINKYADWTQVRPVMLLIMSIANMDHCSQFEACPCWLTSALGYTKCLCRSAVSCVDFHLKNMNELPACSGESHAKDTI